jgi:hypothetical protein
MRRKNEASFLPRYPAWPAGAANSNPWARAPLGQGSKGESLSYSPGPNVIAALPSMTPRSIDYAIPDGIDGVRRRLRPVRYVSGVPRAKETRYVADEVLVEFAKSLSAQAIEKLQRRHRLTSLQSQKLQLTSTTIFRWRIADKRKVAVVVRELEDDAIVASAQPNYIFTLRQDQAAKDAKREVSELRDKQSLSQEDSWIEIPGTGLKPDTAGPSIAPEHTGSVARLIVRDGRLAIEAPGASNPLDQSLDPERSSEEIRTFDILRALDTARAKGGPAIRARLAGPVDPAIDRSLKAADKRDMGVALVEDATISAPLNTAMDPTRE